MPAGQAAFQINALRQLFLQIRKGVHPQPVLTVSPVFPAVIFAAHVDGNLLFFVAHNGHFHLRIPKGRAEGQVIAVLPVQLIPGLLFISVPANLHGVKFKLDGEIGLHAAAADGMAATGFLFKVVDPQSLPQLFQNFVHGFLSRKDNPVTNGVGFPILALFPCSSGFVGGLPEALEDDPGGFDFHIMVGGIVPRELVDIQMSGGDDQIPAIEADKRKYSIVEFKQIQVVFNEILLKIPSFVDNLPY